MPDFSKIDTYSVSTTYTHKDNPTGPRFRSRRGTEPDWAHDIRPAEPDCAEITIKDVIVRQDGRLWWVKEATDDETVQRAITEARITGSVGAIEMVHDIEIDTVTRYADVQRVEPVEPYGGES